VIAKRIPRGVVDVVRGNFDLATTPALRATPPVPGGEQRFSQNLVHPHLDSPRLHMEEDGL